MSKTKGKVATKAKQLAEYEAWYAEQVQLGLDDLEAGRVVSDAEMQDHFQKRFKENGQRQQQQKQAA